MRGAVALILLLGAAAAGPKRGVAQILDDHVRALGAAGRVTTLSATMKLQQQMQKRTQRFDGVTAHWRLPGRFRFDIPLGKPPEGKERVRTEYGSPEGVFVEQERLFERSRPGKVTTRASYYYVRAMSDPFPLLRYARDPQAQKELQLGSTTLKGVVHPVLFTLPDAHAVRTVYILDPVTHLIKNIRYEQNANKPFINITFDGYRNVDGVMLPFFISSYQIAYWESPKVKRVVRYPALHRFAQIVRWEVGADVDGVDFTPPEASSAKGPGFAKRVLRTGADPLDVGIGDLDGDGKPDIAVACWRGLTVHFGGALDDPVFVPLGKGHHAGLAIDDLDGDGRLEAVTASRVEPAQMFFFVGFDAERKPVVRKQYGAPHFTRAIALDDLDLDGVPDFVAVGHQSSDLQIKFGNACGGVRFIGQPWPLNKKDPDLRGLGVAVGDVDGDPMRDIAVVDGTRLLVFQGQWNLSFQPRAALPGLRHPVSVAMADLDGDGRDDLLVVNDDPREAGMAQDLSVVRNRDGKLKVEQNLDLGRRVQAVATGDLDGDGNVDAVTAALLDGEIAVLRGDGKGGFAKPERYGSGRGTSRVAVGDFSGDGRDDIVAANRIDDTITLLVNQREFAPRPRARPRRAVECPPPTRVDYEMKGLSDEYVFAGEFRFPPSLRDPSGITVLGGDYAHAQIVLVSDKEPAFFRAILDRTKGRLVVGPPVPLRGLEKKTLDLEGVAYDFHTGTLFFACEADSSIVRTTIFGQVLGRAPTGVEVGDNDGLEGLALRRKKDGTPLLYAFKERMGTTGRQPYVRVLEMTADPFTLKARGEDLRLPVLAIDQTGAANDAHRLLVLSRLARGIVEVEFKDDGFAPGPHKTTLGALTDGELGLANPKGRLFGVLEGIALGPYGDLYLVADHNGGVMGNAALGNRARAGRLLWFKRKGGRPADRVPARVVFKQILVPFKGAAHAPPEATWSREEAFEKAKQLLDRVRKGEDFDALQAECVAFSTTTRLVRAVFDGYKPRKGEYKRTQLPVALGRLAFNLEPGEAGLVEWHDKEAPRGYRVVLRVE